MATQFADIVMSHARLYRAATGTALPDPTTVGFGGDWGVNWTFLGLTASPLTVGFERSFTDIMVEQFIGPVNQVLTGETLTFETSLAELTSGNIETTFGGAVTSNVGYDEIKGGGDTTINHYTFAFEGRYPDNNNAVRFQILVGHAQTGGTLEFGKETQTGIPLKVNAFFDRDKAEGEQLYIMQLVTS